MTSKKKSPTQRLKKYRVKGQAFRYGTESSSRTIRVDYDFANFIVAEAKERQKPGAWLTAVEVTRLLYKHRVKLRTLLDGK